MSKGRVPWGVISTAKIETSRGDPGDSGFLQR
jgi:hypothetical protein